MSTDRLPATIAEPLVGALDFCCGAVSVRVGHEDLDAIFILLWVFIFWPHVGPGRLHDVNAHTPAILPIADEAAFVRARAKVAALALRDVAPKAEPETVVRADRIRTVVNQR